MFHYIPGDVDPAAGSSVNSLEAFFAVVLNIMLAIGVGITLIGLIAAGIMFITSKGDPKAVDGAKHALTYAVDGIVLLFSAYTIRAIFMGMLGVSHPQLLSPESPFISLPPGPTFNI
jgi:hypothetical protein